MRNYRGLTKEDKWVFGWHTEVDGDATIITNEASFDWSDNEGMGVRGGFIEVIPETVCQSIGIKDKNGKEIYTGDKLTTHRYRNAEDKIDGHVRFDHGAFVIGEGSISLHALWLADDVIEIIGTIHDKETK